jgi:hypothetical protein
LAIFPISGLDKLGVRLLDHRTADNVLAFHLSAKNLMLTSSLIQSEVAPLLYSTNEFKFLSGNYA